MPHHLQLQITKPNGQVEHFPLDPQKGIINIGRDPQNDLVINDPAVELFHAFLDYRQNPPSFVILGSETANGSNVAQLDTLRLADHTLAVVENADPLPDADVSPAALTENTTPFYDFSIGKLQPKRQTISWSRPFAEFAISVANRGNQPAIFHLQGLDDEAACKVEFEPPGRSVGIAGQVDFQLSPGIEASIPIRVTPVHKSLMGFTRQKYHLTITAAVPQSGQSPRSMLGELTVKPLVGPGMLTLLAMALLAFGAFALGPLSKSGLFNPAPVVAGRANASDEVTIFPFTRAEASQTLPELAEVESAALPQNYEEMFREIGPKYNLDWRLLEALAYRESGMNFLAVGRAGDMGLMQIIPSTWGQWAPKVQAQDPFDPYSNILVGAAFLAHMREFCTQRGYTDPRWMLVAYNWGPNRLEKFWNGGGTWGDVPATQRNYASGIVQMSIDRAATTASFEELYPNVVQGQ